MAGGLTKYRHLGRDSAHRQALLRNLVTSLVKHESVHTTWHKAKEAQRLAEKLITLAKRDNEETRRKAQAILFLFGTLKERYANRPGGYTRVLRTEPKKDDQAPSALLELVDGPRDMRFAVTAAAVARDRTLGREHSELTRRNWEKVTKFRPDGSQAFEAMVQRTETLRLADADLQIADTTVPVFLRHEKLKLRGAKPVHDYWSGEGGGNSNSEDAVAAQSLADALGDPAATGGLKDGSSSEEGARRPSRP